MAGETSKPSSTSDPRVVPEPRPMGTNRLIRLIWVAGTTIEIILLFRLLLKFFNANPESAFANLIYTISDWLLIPFQNLGTAIDLGRVVLEGKTLIALLAYLTLSWLVAALFQALTTNR